MKGRGGIQNLGKPADVILELSLKRKQEKKGQKDWGVRCAGMNICKIIANSSPMAVFRQQSFHWNYERFARFPKAVQMVFPFFITVILLWSYFRKIIVNTLSALSIFFSSLSHIYSSLSHKYSSQNQLSYSPAQLKIFL